MLGIRHALSSCRRARAFDAAAGVWLPQRPAPMFFKPEWYVSPKFQKRSDADSATFCWPLDAHEAAASMRANLRSRALRSIAGKAPPLPLTQLLAETDFVRQRHWDSLGLPSSSADVNHFVTRYVHMLILEMLHKRDKQGLPQSRKSDENCGKVADTLQADLEWLEREAVTCYIRHFHATALPVLQAHPDPDAT